MDIDIKCNVLEAKYCIKNGMIRCVEPFVFSLTDPAKVQIEIKEMGIRVITLSTDEKVEARKLYAILVKPEKLLQIFDGAFVPLEGIVLHGEAMITMIPIVMGKLQGKMQKKKSEELASFLSLVTDVFEGFSVIASFGVNSIYKNRLNQKLNEVNKAEYTSEKWKAVTDGVAQALSATVQAALFVYAGVLLIKGKLSIGSFFVFSSLNTNICSSMTMLLRTVPSLMSIKPIMSKLDEFCTIRERKEIKTSIAFDKGILVEKLSFGYEEGKDVLHDQSLKFEKGRKYAIIGKSGVGKSTLIQLLRGEFFDYKGTIRYDDTELKDCDEDSIRKLSALVEQDTFLFQDTIKNNISLYEPFTDEQLKEALTRAGLEEFIETLPEKMEHRVEEKGKNLSGGQKQRIALARAFVRNRQFIILDEGTSALDQKTSEDIENMLLQTQGLTLIIITHHLTERKKYDMVYEIG